MFIIKIIDEIIDLDSGESTHQVECCDSYRVSPMTEGSHELLDLFEGDNTYDYMCLPFVYYRESENKKVKCYTIEMIKGDDVKEVLVGTKFFITNENGKTIDSYSC